MAEKKSPRVVAEALLRDGPMHAAAWIDGAKVEAGRFGRESPIDGRVVSHVADGGAREIDAAVKAARRAFDSGPWPRMTPEERRDALARLAALIRARDAELAAAETLENGMPFGMCKNRNIAEAADCWQWFGEAAGKLSDESMWLDPRNFAAVSREPSGVVGLIVPWNFPMMIAAWKAAPALAAGCAAVLKPSEMAAAAISRLGGLAKEAGVPDGILNIVPGRGETAGAALAAHPEVDCVAFTGSTAVGKRIMSAASANLKRVWLECGGKTAVIVLDDGRDFAADVESAARAFFRHQGQICNAGSRLLVPAARAGEAAEIAARVAASLKIGNPLDAEVDFGPVISEAAAESIVAAIRRAVGEGAKLACGGARAQEGGGGSYVSPTVLSGVSPKMEAARREIFGPALAVMPFADEEDAVAIANGVDYGLGACVFTRDLSRAHLLARKLRAGHVLVNKAAGASLRLPFGGFKQSGFGRDKSLHAFDKYTELKATTFSL